MSDTGGGTAPSPPAGDGPPALGVRAQYVKDFSFENPNAPMSLVQSEGQPRIEVAVNVEARALSGPLFEVSLRIHGEAKHADKVAFVVELVYGGVFDLARIPEAQRHPVCLIEAPRLLFPFARRIVAEATRDGGFPPMYLDPIDFMALYRDHLAKQGASAAAPAQQA
ncbi:MAG: protein-export chaperone SecB [Alphaproteobacteria bacterium]|nr:protein-export chaperone SecB [Alphaproteobacteria bacterium]